MTPPLSITSTTKDYDVPFILPINSQADLSRSIRLQSETKAQQFQSFVNTSSDAPVSEKSRKYHYYDNNTININVERRKINRIKKDEDILSNQHPNEYKLISYTEHEHRATESYEVLRIGTNDDVSNNLNSITEVRDKTIIAYDIKGKDNSTSNSIIRTCSTHSVMKYSNISLRCDNEGDDCKHNYTRFSDEISDNIK